MSVSQDDPRPPYRQIADDIRSSIKDGSLAPGQRLTAGRELAKKYGVAQQTVVRAIEILKAEGLLESHPPQGTFIRRPESDEATPRSAEFEAVMSQLDGLQEDLRAQLDAFDQRLRKIEREIHRPD